MAALRFQTAGETSKAPGIDPSGIVWRGFGESEVDWIIKVKISKLEALAVFLLQAQGRTITCFPICPVRQVTEFSTCPIAKTWLPKLAHVCLNGSSWFFSQTSACKTVKLSLSVSLKINQFV